MEQTITSILEAIILCPLLGALIAGLAGKRIGTVASHRITIFLVGISLVLSGVIAKWVLFDGLGPFDNEFYIWGSSGGFQFTVGYLLDPLTAVMLLVVTFVSFLVHIYSIGYMQGDPGYQRFFSYVSLFTFAMLTLVTGDNFLQLFFGWEGVGLVSYLLIGFWFNKESANLGSMKAFIVNRVGDFGFLLGIALILDNFGTLSYGQIFNTLQEVVPHTITVLPNHPWPVLTVICLLLFVGAMGKSAQVPLHVWLPESMEGPTPISALIHAATMVTAGIYMVARMSPIYQLSPTALSVLLIIGATGALFTGLIAIVQNDIKRVVAYSTLSQLGYMVAALGASAYAVSIFHLATHACFKALLFLGAGSVIIAMHHEQDMRKMGGLWRKMPITYITFVIGSLALCAIPPLAGYYSKDAIIEAVRDTHIIGADYAYVCVLLGSFVTAFYTFRSVFMTFHGKPRYDTHHLHPEESPWVVWLPLVALAIPSIFLGALLVGPMILHSPGLLGDSVVNLPKPAELSHETWTTLALQCYESPAFWCAVSGIFAAWLAYIALPFIPKLVSTILFLPYYILIKKYGFDDLYQLVFVRGSRSLASLFYKKGDVLIIDDVCVNGSGRVVLWLSRIGRKLQSGLIYHYVFIMLFSFVILLAYMVWR